MLQLFDTLYSFDYDGDLSPYLMAEEKEDYQMALGHQRRAQTELASVQSGGGRGGEGAAVLPAGIGAGDQAGGAGGAVGISPPGAGERRAAQVCRPYREKRSTP